MENNIGMPRIYNNIELSIIEFLRKGLEIDCIVINPKDHAEIELFSLRYVTGISFIKEWCGAKIYRSEDMEVGKFKVCASPTQQP